MKIIYDLGSNNGDDIPYYLLKADVVVAVEANPSLCELIRQRFATELNTGRVIVENCVVTADREPLEVDFYIHRSNHVLSQFPPPAAARADKFTRVRIPSVPILDIVAARGQPYYVKIDLEHYDAPILDALFRAGIRPPYISAEAHSAKTFALLVGLGHYDSFKLVDGGSVSALYADRSIVNNADCSSVHYSFPKHSAGPFGDDLDGEWMTADDFLICLAIEGLGWKDIHATTTVVADRTVVSMLPYARREVSRRLRGSRRKAFGRIRALLARAATQLRIRNK
jgi:FkbM family methyltransferase